MAFQWQSPCQFPLVYTPKGQVAFLRAVRHMSPVLREGGGVTN